MRPDRTLETLRQRLAVEEAAWDALRRQQEGYVRIAMTRYLSENRKASLAARRIAALRTAIGFLERPFCEVDFHEGCLMGLSPVRDDWQDILDKASSNMPNERAKAARVLFGASLPVARRQVLAELDRRFPASNPQMRP